MCEIIRINFIELFNSANDLYNVFNNDIFNENLNMYSFARLPEAFFKSDDCDKFLLLPNLANNVTQIPDQKLKLSFD